MKRLTAFNSFIFALLFSNAIASAQTQTPTTITPVSITSLATPYTQNFDTLANSGTTSNTLPQGWAIVESGSNADSTYGISDGATTSGNTYSFGTTGATDRALGSIASANLSPMFGAVFQNNTGRTITSLTIAYRGEQWRYGGASTSASPDMLDFQYNQNAASLTATGFTAFSALNFSSPHTTGSSGKLDGNAAGNNANISATISGLNIANGAKFAIRFVDVDIAGSDDGLAVDDFSLTANTTTQISLQSFTATSFTNGVLLEWRTGYETNNLGFNLYRERNGARTRLNSALIAGSALTTAQTLSAGSSYSWFDAEGSADSIYYIEDVDLSGASASWQPAFPIVKAANDANADYRQRRAPLLKQIGLPSETNLRFAQRGQPATWNNLSANITGIWRAQTASAGNLSPQIPTPQQLTQRAIAAGRAVKIGVKRNGWYRVKGADLIAAGFDAEIHPNFLQLYADGQEVPIIVSNENAGVFGASDYVEFYGLGLNTPTADTRIYYLIVGNQPGRRIKTLQATARKHPIHALATTDARNVESETLVDESIASSKNREFDSSKQSLARNITQLDSRMSRSQIPSLKIDRIAVADAPNSFPYTIERRDRTIFFGGLLADGDSFFGAPVTSDSTTETLAVTNLDPNGQAILKIALQGVSLIPHKIQVSVNGTDVGRLAFESRENSAQSLILPPNLIREGDNSIALTSIGDSLNNQTDVSLIDFVALTYAHLYRADENALMFSIGGGETVKVESFNASRVRVVDLTNPSEPVELTPRVEAADGKYSITLTAPKGGARTLYAFLDGASDEPTEIILNQPSTLSHPENAADFVIIAHRSLRDTVEPLRALRASQGMNVMVVDVEDIYDEFSFGAHDPQAITDFFNYALTNWQTPPRFALLVGDATYDPRNYLGFGDYDLVPTKLVVTQYSKTASDDALADFTGDGLAALAIGRLPARTPAQARLMIEKIVNYAPDAQARKVLLVADSTQAEYSFANENDALRQYLPPDISAQAINRGEAADDAIRGRIVDALNAGALIVNFAGHGAFDRWTGGAILSNADARALTNGARLPFFSVMTCMNGYFQDPSPKNDSLAETLMNAEAGGAIAVWASSGLTVPTGQTAINRELYRQIFGGNPRPLGEAIRQAKRATDDIDVRRTWILFGDPTLRIK